MPLCTCYGMVRLPQFTRRQRWNLPASPAELPACLPGSQPAGRGRNDLLVGLSQCRVERSSLHQLCGVLLSKPVAENPATLSFHSPRTNGPQIQFTQTNWSNVHDCSKLSFLNSPVQPQLVRGNPYLALFSLDNKGTRPAPSPANSQQRNIGAACGMGRGHIQHQLHSKEPGPLLQ